MMPILLDVQKRLLAKKSPAENAKDVQKVLDAADHAAAVHNRVLRTHVPNAPDSALSRVRVHEPPGQGILFVWLTIASDLMHTKSPDENACDVAECLQAAVHAAAEHNRLLLEHHPWLPDVYELGVRYIVDPNAWRIQTLKSIPLIKQQGGSDCKNLVAAQLGHMWRAELLAPPQGFGKRMSRCKIYWRIIEGDKLTNMLPPEMLEQLPADGPIRPGRLFHAEMRKPDKPYPIGYSTPDGEVEDMSRYLGM
jgi:hypothetical protein